MLRIPRRQLLRGGAALSATKLSAVKAGFILGKAGGGGGGGYAAKAVHFDGNTWLVNPALVATDGPSFSFMYWFANTDISQASMNFGLTFVVDPENNYLTNLDNLGSVPEDPVIMHLDMAVYNSLGTKSLAVTNAAGTVADLSWHQLIYSCDATDAVMLVDGVSVGTITHDDRPFNAAFNGLSFWFGSDNFGGGLGSGILGDVADVWVAPNVSLLTAGVISPATLALFRDGNGKPTDPSGFPAGGAVLFSGDHTSFPINQGTGGPFAVSAGHLTNATTSPSD